ncbi:MAG: hypothetical protein SFU56_05995 [Capsulimonadales bacterium]|nr:hypothetical protein [Capsulimonadales bacterium]
MSDEMNEEGIVEARARFEQEKMSRRAALKKIGVQSAMAVLGVFSVEQLAQAASASMKNRERNNRVTHEVAKQFKDAGISVTAAADPSPGWCLEPGCSTDCTPTPGKECVPCTWWGCADRKKLQNIPWRPCPGQTACIGCAAYFAETCRKSNPGDALACCQSACGDCCTPGPGKPKLPCGIRADAVVHACQSACAKIFGSGI